jgi:hypothetical protein
MARTTAILAAALLLSGGAAPAQDRPVIIDTESGTAPAKEVYAVRTVGGPEETRRFGRNHSSWSGALPVGPQQRWAVRLDYRSGISPDALKLELSIDPSVKRIEIVLPRPNPRAECHVDDETALRSRTAQRAGSRDAAGIIVQIDHLLAPNRPFPCPPIVAAALQKLRVENVRYLRERIPAIRSM